MTTRPLDNKSLKRYIYTAIPLLTMLACRTTGSTGLSPETFCNAGEVGSIATYHDDESGSTFYYFDPFAFSENTDIVQVVKDYGISCVFAGNGPDYVYQIIGNGLNAWLINSDGEPIETIPTDGSQFIVPAGMFISIESPAGSVPGLVGLPNETQSPIALIETRE